MSRPKELFTLGAVIAIISVCLGFSTAFSSAKSQVRVAILDTGVDYTSPYLNIVGNYDMCLGDGEGLLPDPMDHDGHGTSVAHIIGSTNPHQLGIVPGIQILNIKVAHRHIDLDMDGVCDYAGHNHDRDGDGHVEPSEEYLATSWSIIHGIQLAERLGASVVNISLTTEQVSGNGESILTRYVDMMSYVHNMVVVVAAGNQGEESSIGAPGDGYNVITVGVLGGDSGPTADGRVKPDLYAKGSATTPTSSGVTNPEHPYYGKAYSHYSGTSQAAARVTAVAALLKTINPKLSPTEIKALLINTSSYNRTINPSKAIKEVYTTKGFILTPNKPVDLVIHVTQLGLEAEPLRLTLTWQRPPTTPPLQLPHITVQLLSPDGETIELTPKNRENTVRTIQPPKLGAWRLIVQSNTTTKLGIATNYPTTTLPTTLLTTLNTN